MDWNGMKREGFVLWGLLCFPFPFCALSVRELEFDSVSPSPFISKTYFSIYVERVWC